MADPGPTSEDHAIIVGVGRYRDKALRALPGARTDAGRFYRWLTSPAGGDVPASNVWLFPDDGREVDATLDELQAAFRALCKRGERKVKIGRRLYVYLSGHGIAQNMEEASLLAADGGPLDWSRHIPGEAYAQWFQYSAYFEQVVLFADCCRTARRDVPLQAFPLPAVHSASQQEVLMVRGFAAPYGQEALERRDGQDYGVFTRALLEALERAYDSKGKITALSIQEFLYNHPKLQEWQVLPRFAVIGNGAEIVFGTGQVTRTVLIQVKEKDKEPPTLLGGPPRDEPWKLTQDGECRYRAELLRGIYAVKAGGRTQFFEVTGAAEQEEELHVSV